MIRQELTTFPAQASQHLKREENRSSDSTSWRLNFTGKLSRANFARDNILASDWSINNGIDLSCVIACTCAEQWNHPLNISLTANNHFWYCCPFFASDFQDFMHNSTGYVIKQMVHAFSCALSSYGAPREVWRALKKLEMPWVIASGNSYASFVPSKLPACSITR